MRNRGPRVEELYATHAQGAVRLAYLLVGDVETAQDLAQEAFLRAFGRFADLRRPGAWRDQISLINPCSA